MIDYLPAPHVFAFAGNGGGEQVYFPCPRVRGCQTAAIEMGMGKEKNIKEGIRSEALARYAEKEI